MNDGKDDDVPITVDFRREADARKWVAESEQKRPYRAAARALIADHVAMRGARRFLELGGGPGLLGEAIIARGPCHYTLLDFAEPMLMRAHQRVPSATCLRRDLLDAAWTRGLGPFDAVVTMQAVHELRHKRRMPALYSQVHAALEPGGLFVVCDHEPLDARPLHASEAEQRSALAGTGFREISMLARFGTLYIISCTASS